MKKKLTLSMALAFALCLCIVTASALAASHMLTSVQPDATQKPLVQPDGTHSPEDVPDQPNETVWLDDQEEPVYHLTTECTEIQDVSSLTGMTLADAGLHGGSPCPVCCVIACYEDMDDAALYHLFSGCPLMKTCTESQINEMILSGRRLCSGCALLLMNHQGEIGLLASWPEEIAATPIPTPSPDLLQPTPEPDFAETTPVPTPTVTPQPTEQVSVSSTPIPMQTDEPVYVWSREDEEYYHACQDCDKTDTPQRAVLAVAINRNQKPCPLCHVESTPTPTVTPQPTSQPESTQTPAPSPLPALGTEENASLSPWSENEYYSDLCQEYVYSASFDLSGLYHQSPLCPTLKDAEDLSMIPLETAVASGKTACPDCTFCFPDPNTPDFYHMYAGCPAAGDPNIRYSTRSIDDDETACSECTVYISDRNTFAGAHGSFYHAVPACPSASHASPHSRKYADMLGLTPCPECLPEEQAVDKEPASSDPDSRQAEWTTIDCSSFDTCMELTLHSAATLRTRGCLYAEFEFTVNDDSISPYSIRIVPVGSGGAELGVLSSATFDTTDADGETVYLLCETMPAAADPFVIEALHIYGGSSSDEQKLLAELK